MANPNLRKPPPDGIRPKDGADSIWRDQRFVRVLAAFTLSQLGSNITIVVLPLIATTVLHASALQIGMLGTANTLPFLLLGPLVGVLADRLPRRAIIIAADTVRAIILAVAIVIISKRTLNGIGLLYVVAFGIGAANVWFDIAHGAYVPRVVKRERLIAANGRLSGSQSLIETTGPVIGGSAMQIFGASSALVCSGLFYVLSAAVLFNVKEIAPSGGAAIKASMSVLKSMHEGITFIFRHPLLRILTLRLAAWHLVVGAVQSLLVLFLVRQLHLTPASTGAVLSVVGFGTVLAALTASTLSARIGIGPTIMACNVAAAAAAPLLVAAHGSDHQAIVMAGAALFVYGYCFIAYQINNASLRQAITPDAMLGQMGAANRVVTLGINALGAIGAGLIAQHFGVRTAMACFAAIGVCCAVKGALSSPLRSIKTLPACVDG